MKRLYLVLVAAILVGCEAKGGGDQGAGVSGATGVETTPAHYRTAEAIRAKEYRVDLPSWHQVMKPEQVVLDIVVVPDPPWVYYDPSEKYEAHHYSGLIIDAIYDAANILGFTPRFHNPSDENKETGFRGTYGQGHTDVVSGLRDLYWSAYFITDARAQEVDFAVPYVQEGLRIATLRKSETDARYFTKALTVLAPFSAELWAMLVLITLFAAFVFFVAERGQTNEGDFDELCDRAHGVSLAKTGVAAFFDDLYFQYGKSVYLTANSFPASHAHTCVTKLGRSFSTIWVLFCVIIISVYTANLAAYLSQTTVTSDVVDIDLLVATGESVCVLNGTAYSKVLAKQLPRVKFVYRSSLDEMAEGVISGACLAMIHQNAVVEWAATKQWSGSCPLEAVGEPFFQGPSMLGIGVGRQHRQNVTNYLTLALLDQQTFGIYDELSDFHRQNHVDGRCLAGYDANEDDESSMPFENLAGLFLFVGVFGCFIVIKRMRTMDDTYDGIGSHKVRFPLSLLACAFLSRENGSRCVCCHVFVVARILRTLRPRRGALPMASRREGAS
jgi:ABC-type amino acid transport substrate-binding protein